MNDRAGPGAGEMWRHYKGGLYQIVAIGKLEATLEPAVIYHEVHNPMGVWWIRPLNDFMGTVAGELRFALAHKGGGGRAKPLSAMSWDELQKVYPRE